MLNQVNPDNFARAESDMYFSGVVKDGAFGKLQHYRELMPIARQTVVRANRDTLYSPGVFDLDAGPVTITLPEHGERFMSMQVIDEEQYSCMVVYDPGDTTLTKDAIGTRYVLVALRTLVDPRSPEDVKQAHALQDAVKVSQRSSGKFDVPRWDQASQKKVRDALLKLGETLADSRHMFGTREDTEPVRHLIGTAIGWGGNPEKDAIYLMVVPPKNDGTTVHELTVKDVPIDGFWSISVYNAKGYFEPNPENAYTVNNLTATRAPDGSVRVLFGGKDAQANCLPITPGWNYTVRLYRPRAAILDGTWSFPEARPVP